MKAGPWEHLGEFANFANGPCPWMELRERDILSVMIMAFSRFAREEKRERFTLLYLENV